MRQVFSILSRAAVEGAAAASASFASFASLTQHLPRKRGEDQDRT